MTGDFPQFIPQSFPIFPNPFPTPFFSEVGIFFVLTFAPSSEMSSRICERAIQRKSGSREQYGRKDPKSDEMRRKDFRAE